MTYITGMFVELLYRIYAFIVGILDIIPMHARCVLGPRVICRPFEPPSVQLAVVTLEHPLLPDLPALRLPDLVETGLSGTHLQHVTTSTTESVSTETVISCTPVASALGSTPPQNARNECLVDFFPLPETIVTPVNIDLLEFYLTEHPNRRLVNYIVQGFKLGLFDIGFVGNILSTRPRNLLSSCRNQIPVSEAIKKELSRGHTSGPFPEPPFHPFHCSPLGAVPKKDGLFRIILDLSSPRGCSVNEGISREEFSVKYTSFDDAVALVRSLGQGAFMAKLDIKHAFRLCPVRPDQWGLLGYSWDDQFFVDTRLPFGSRSSPFIFNTFADLLLWILVVVFGILLCNTLSR